MYAVIETGGKQYRVELGAELELDQLAAAPGDKIDLGRVLLVADGDSARVGQPVVDGARITAEVVRATRGEKVVVFKYRPKARHRVKQGHRQDLTVVRVADIEFDGRSAAREAQSKAEQEAQARAEAARAAEARAAADRELAERLAREQAALAEQQEGPNEPAAAKPKSRRTSAKREAGAPDSEAPTQEAGTEPEAGETRTTTPATETTASTDSPARRRTRTKKDE
ncbi:MAG: 50S ribosomal protein L21 [Chloroflexota bacterium]|nr:50S ribosomal protein L21 [Chloroflexota bacterium]